MNRPIRILFLAAATVGSATAGPTRAQSPDVEGGGGTPPASRAAGQEPGDARREMQRDFATRLRAELGLTDEQMVALTPEIEALEQTRVRNQQQRRELGVELRRAVDGGTADAEVQAILDRFDEASVRHETDLRERLRKIDRSLTVRQRAELRFFLARVRQDVERRGRDFRQSGRRPSRP